MSLSKKRSFGQSEAGQGSKKQPRKARIPKVPRPEVPLDDPHNTIRCQPLDGRPMVSMELVQCYTQQHGESLFMEMNEKGRYIDVRFVDNDDAQTVLAEHSSYPFTVDWTRTIDASQIITPGTVEMYQPPRDRGHYDEEPSVPLPCTNPFPIRFAPTQESNGRVRPIYPPTVQPKAPSPKAPFEKPTWPAPPDRDFFMTNYV